MRFTCTFVPFDGQLGRPRPFSATCVGDRNDQHSKKASFLPGRSSSTCFHHPFSFARARSDASEPMPFQAPRRISARFVVGRGPLRSCTCFFRPFSVRSRSIRVASPTCSRVQHAPLPSLPPRFTSSLLPAAEHASTPLRWHVQCFGPSDRRSSCHVRTKTGGAKVREDREARQKRPLEIRSCRVRRPTCENKTSKCA